MDVEFCLMAVMRFLISLNVENTQSLRVVSISEKVPVRKTHIPIPVMCEKVCVRE